MLSKICKLESRSKNLVKKIHIIKIYNNQVKRRCTWISDISCTQKAFEDIK